MRPSMPASTGGTLAPSTSPATRSVRMCGSCRTARRSMAGRRRPAGGATTPKNRRAECPAPAAGVEAVASGATQLVPRPLSFRRALLSAMAVAMAATLVAGPDAGDDWPAYGHDPGGSRYSPLTQISPDNVSRLHVAWEFHTG